MRRLALLVAVLLVVPLSTVARAASRHTSHEGAAHQGAKPHHHAPLVAGTPSDFNGDGFADLAVGVALEDLGKAKDAGAVNVIYGSATGLASTGNQLWTETNDGTGDPAQTGDEFGAAVASGDFNGDGFWDLAIGVPGDDLVAIGPDGKTVSRVNAGAVTVLYGSATGLSSTSPIPAQRWKQDSPGILGVSELNDTFGTNLTTGDFNADGISDLAIGVPGETIGSASGTGVVNVIYGSAAGLTSTGNQMFIQGGGGVPGSSTSGDGFGFGLAAGHFGGTDPLADALAIGAPFDHEAGPSQSGAVTVLYGATGSGLTTTGSQLWTQNSTDVLGIAEAGDLFGFDLAVGDFNGDGAAELAIGDPGEGIRGFPGAGSVNVLHGDLLTGLTAAGNQLFSQGTGGLGGTAGANEGFGNSMWAGDMGISAESDLAIAAASDTVGTISGAGSVTAIYGSASGLATAGNQVWTQNSPGILGLAETGDLFGFDIFVGNFGNGPEADLAVGVALEDLCGGADVPRRPGATCRADAGAVNAIYGSPTGLTSTGNQQWTQDSPGILGVAEANDLFGFDVS